MKIELIPVIEIGYANQGVTPPGKYPYWDNAQIWNNYYQKCYLKAGFEDHLQPYLKGAAFFRLTDISEKNLIKLTIDHSQKLRNGDHARDGTCTFFGGYVLKIDGEDKYFPQCCGELSDITYWARVSNGQDEYCEGHPAPTIIFKDSNVEFDFSVREFDEYFQPTPAENTLLIDLHELKRAVEKVKVELHAFEQRLNKINVDEKLNIENIGGLLIWDNGNYH